ncbi:MAG: hypothetical protein NT039_02085 [Candidatus Berkelbacteria bacterium]|nr:hypothetical protein [Candidatus Berkelbacteria bacterium]
MSEPGPESPRESSPEMLLKENEEASEVMRRLGYGSAGVSLWEQRRNYEGNLKPWSGREGFPTITPKGLTETVQKQLEDIKGSQNLQELQHHLVILNVNEFKLRISPTKDEFADLVSDCSIWEKRTDDVLSGGDEAKEEYFSARDQVTQEATAKYEELAKDLDGELGQK